MKTIFTIATFIVWLGMIGVPLVKGGEVIIEEIKDIISTYPTLRKGERLSFVMGEMPWIFFGLFLVSIAVMVALYPFIQLV